MSEHNHEHATASKNLIWSIGINTIIVIFEIIFGLISRSFALITDTLFSLGVVASAAIIYFTG